MERRELQATKQVEENRGRIGLLKKVTSKEQKIKNKMKSSSSLCHLYSLTHFAGKLRLELILDVAAAPLQVVTPVLQLSYCKQLARRRFPRCIKLRDQRGGQRTCRSESCREPNLARRKRFKLSLQLLQTTLQSPSCREQ